jgi:hypothetical protein
MSVSRHDKLINRLTRRQILGRGSAAGLAGVGLASVAGSARAAAPAPDAAGASSGPASGPATTMSQAELSYWQDRAAMLDPRAYVFQHGPGLSLTVPAGKRWYARNLWGIMGEYRIDPGCSTVATVGPDAFVLNDPSLTPADVGKRVSGSVIPNAPGSKTFLVSASAGRGIMSAPATAVVSGFTVHLWIDRYLREPTMERAQLMPGGETILGAPASSAEVATIYVCQPELVVPPPYGSGTDSRYTTDPQLLYYTRLQTLSTLTPYHASAAVPPGAPPGAAAAAPIPYDFKYGLAMGVTVMDAPWVVLSALHGGGLNLWDEISDFHMLRFATDGFLLPFSRSIFTQVTVMGGSVGGDRVSPVGGGAGSTQPPLASRGSMRYFKLPSGW